MNIYTNKFMHIFKDKSRRHRSILESKRAIVHHRTWRLLSIDWAEFHQRAFFAYALIDIFTKAALLECILSWL